MIHISPESMVGTIILAVIASNGLWTFILNVWQSKHTKNSASNQMLLGLGHDRLYELCTRYIKRGYVTTDEYENLKKYLYEPYRKMGGNGTGERLMREVDKLPIQDD